MRVTKLSVNVCEHRVERITTQCQRRQQQEQQMSEAWFVFVLFVGLVDVVAYIDAAGDGLGLLGDGFGGALQLLPQARHAFLQAIVNAG